MTSIAKKYFRYKSGLVLLQRLMDEKLAKIYSTVDSSEYLGFLIMKDGDIFPVGEVSIERQDVNNTEDEIAREFWGENNAKDGSATARWVVPNYKGVIASLTSV